MWPQRSDDADDLPGYRAAPYGLAAAGLRGQRVGTGVLRALRPGRGAPRGGELLDLPLLQLIGEVGEPLRGGEVDQDADAPGPGAAWRLDPGGHAVRPAVVVCLLNDVRHDRAAAAQVTQDRFQGRPQFRALGIGQRPRIPAQLQGTAGGLGRLGSDRPPDRGDQILLVIEEPATRVWLHDTSLKAVASGTAVFLSAAISLTVPQRPTVSKRPHRPPYSGGEDC